DDLRGSGRLAETVSAGQKVLIETDRLRELEQRILDVLGRLHADQPLLTVHDRQKVLAQLGYVGDDGLLQGAVERMIKEKKLVGDAKRIARADFKPKL